MPNHQRPHNLPSHISQLNTRVANSPLALQCARHRKLAGIIQTLLPEDIAPWCTLGNIHGEHLTMVAASSSWASRLRFIAPVLIKQINQTLGVNIHRLDIKIDTLLFSLSEKEEKKSLHLSPSAADLLGKAAESCPSPELKTLFSKLAAHAKSDQSRE